MISKKIGIHFTRIRSHSNPNKRITEKSETRLTQTLNGSVIESLFPSQKPEQPDPNNPNNNSKI
ncbi:hypothetical protein Hanom_Chr06g00503941 [Helianthus anomalus]